MSCFTTPKWPYCHPDESDDIYGCSSPNLGAAQACCLSDQTQSEDVDNCPPGWKSNPGEWCTSNWNAFAANEYRHKCERVVCNSDKLNPLTNCQTCMDSTRAAPACDTCLDPHQRVCNGKCIDVWYDENNCGGCGTQCGNCQICDEGKCKCGVK